MIASFPTVDAFYEARGGERSGERDFGGMWTDSNPHWSDRYRVSVVHDTGDVYAHRQTYLHDVDRIIVLGRLEHTRLCANLRNGAHDTELCAYEIAERLFAGWTDRIGVRDSLDWIRERLASAVRA